MIKIIPFYFIQLIFVILRRSINFQRDNFWVSNVWYPLSRYATNYHLEYWHQYEVQATARVCRPRIVKQTEYRLCNFNLRNLQLRACMRASGRHKRTGAVCGFIRVCVVGIGKNSVAQFRPSPRDAVGPSCIHAYTGTATYEVCSCNFRLASNGVAPAKKRPRTSVEKKRRRDRGELVVTNVPR